MEKRINKAIYSASRRAGLVDRMEGKELEKRADALWLREEGRRRRLRWEDCVKRDLARVGGEGRGDGIGDGRRR